MSDVEALRAQLTEAEATATKLLTGIQEIECQLGAPSRIDRETGQPMTEEKYGQWRQRANYAKINKLKEYRRLKPEIYRLRELIQSTERPYSPPLTTRQVEILNHVWAELANRDALPVSLEMEESLQLTDDDVEWLADLTSTALEVYTGGPKDG